MTESSKPGIEKLLKPIDQVNINGDINIQTDVDNMIINDETNIDEDDLLLGDIDVKLDDIDDIGDLSEYNLPKIKIKIKNKNKPTKFVQIYFL